MRRGEITSTNMDAKAIYIDSDLQTSSSTLYPSRHGLADSDDEDGDGNRGQIAWVKSWWFKRLVQLCAFVSLISLSMNTPETFKNHHSLKYVTLALDFAVVLVFTAEMAAQIRNFGLFKKQNSYFRRPPCIFNGVMVLFIWLSIILQLVELRGYEPKNYVAFSIPRAPRVLVMHRVFKLFVSFKLPPAVARRCKQQIGSVAIFFAYFVLLGAIIGTQMFGPDSRFCLRKGADLNNISHNDVLISPSSRCSADTFGFQCPANFSCENVDSDLVGKHYFRNFLYSLLTVYESSTQEGWVLVMYEMMSFQASGLVIVYFSLLIFFIAWLVKNVFIAVVSETFADIRSQYSSTKWRVRRRYTGLSCQVIKDEGTGWHLISVDHEASKGHAPLRVRKIVFSIYFKYGILVCVLVDALLPVIPNVSGTSIYMAFTFLFDIEALLKIWCVGFRPYLKLRMHIIEFILAVGSTLFSWPLIASKSFAVFHVTRVVRLVDAVPSLKEFCQRVLGTGKNLGSVVLFTLFFVMVSSALSVQLFSTLKDGDSLPFGTYPEALLAMFQIITQEGWVEILDNLRHGAGAGLSFLVALYIVAYNLFSSLIIMSVFVAVIVDNLELGEEVKMLKQKKLGEESKEMKEKLPVRLRVYERFRDNPRLVAMSRMKSVSEFSMPKIRESFLKQFVGSRSVDDSVLDNAEEEKMQTEHKRLNERRSALPARLINPTVAETKVTKFLRQQSSISALITESYHRRNAALSPGELSPRRGLVHTPSMLSSSRRVRARPSQLSRSASHAKAQESVRTMTRSTSETSSLQHQLSRDDLDVHTVREKREEAHRKRVAQVERLRENHPFFDQPLFVLQRDSLVRDWLRKWVHARHAVPLHPRTRGAGNSGFGIKLLRLHHMLASQTYLEWVMIAVTIASTISIMLEKPDQRTFQEPVSAAFEYIFIVSMTVELLLRILADGLFFTPHAVIQSFGGVLDVFIYLVGLIYTCWQPASIPAHSGTQALLVLRCLRPLRIITLVPHMRQVILELVTGYKQILKVSALQLLLMFIFASYGVQVFSDNLARCNDRNVTNEKECVGTFSMPLAEPDMFRSISGPRPKMLVPRVWKNPRNFNFDNVWNAFLALFEALTLEGWLEMRDVIKESSLGPSYVLYVHVYVLLGSMVGLTLFVGVIVTNFNENKGIALLTVDQRRWQDLKKRLRLAQPLHVPPRPDAAGLRTLLFDVAQSKIYKRIVVGVILVNCATLAAAHWHTADQRLRDGLTGLAVACALLFVADAILKIVALTFRGYWHSRRNRFDFVLACLGVPWVILHFSVEGEGRLSEIATGFGVSIIVFRFLTLSGKHPLLKSLMLTVVMSLVKSFFIIAVLFILIICYALAGCVLFGTVKFGEAINRNANLSTSSNAMILLFRITTGEDWNKIMHDCMIKPPHCTEADNFWESDCGHEAAALVYFISFYVIITFVFLNLFIAVIIENFSLFYSSDEDSLITNTDLRDFQLTWNLVDKSRRGTLTVRQARLVLRLLPRGRLEVDSGSLIFKHMCCEIEKLRNGGDVSFHDVLSVLAYNSVDISRCLQLEELLEREELECAIEEEVAIQTIRDWFIRVRQRRAERQRLQLLGQNSPLGSSNDSMSDHDDRRFESSEEDESGGNSPRDPSRDAPSTLLPSTQPAPSLSRRFAKKERTLAGHRKRSGSVTFPDEVAGRRRSSAHEIPTRTRKSVVTELPESGMEVRHWWNGLSAKAVKPQTSTPKD